MRLKRMLVRTLDPAGGTAGQGIVIDPTGKKFIVDDLPGGITGLTSDDSSVTITDNGDGTLDLAADGGGGLESVVAGTGISVDNTDPANPVVSATGGGGGGSGIAPLGTPQGTLQRAYKFDTTIQSWTASAGTLAWDSGGYLKHTVFGSGAHYVLLEPSGAGAVADGEFVVDLHSVASAGTDLQFNLIFRAADASNYYAMFFRFNAGNNGMVQLYKRVSGSFANIAGSYAAPNSAQMMAPFVYPSTGILNLRLMVRFVGGWITAFLNEIPLGVWNDTTYTTGICGMGEYPSGGSQVYMWDNALVYSLSSGWAPPPYA